MGKMFNSDGKLNIPSERKIKMSKDKIEVGKDKYIVKEAYCPNGHSMMSNIQIEDHPGIHFIYTDSEGKKESDIVVSAVVGECPKKILKGEPFRKGEIIKVLCPICQIELPVLLDCQCGAPIVLFYLDKQLNPHYSQSFCSRIGCVKSSQLRFSQDELREFVHKYSF